MTQEFKIEKGYSYSEIRPIYGDEIGMETLRIEFKNSHGREWKPEVKIEALEFLVNHLKSKL
jgi:hypothetical protein